MEIYYKNSYPDIYKKIVLPYFQYMTDYLLTDYLLSLQLWKLENDNMSIESFCNKKENKYLQNHMSSKEELNKLKDKGVYLAVKSIEIIFSDSIDSKIEVVCNKNIITPINSGDRIPIN